MKELQSSPPDSTLKAPSFSHAKKDPIPDDIIILPSHRLVIFEGLYANLNEGAWVEAGRLYDERWVIECSEQVARQRLIERHVATGVAIDQHEAEWRGMCDTLFSPMSLSHFLADNNDIPNGRYLLQHVLEPARRLYSNDDETWRSID